MLRIICFVAGAAATFLAVSNPSFSIQGQALLEHAGVGPALGYIVLFGMSPLIAGYAAGYLFDRREP